MSSSYESQSIFYLLINFKPRITRQNLLSAEDEEKTRWQYWRVATKYRSTQKGKLRRVEDEGNSWKSNRVTEETIRLMNERLREAKRLKTNILWDMSRQRRYKVTQITSPGKRSNYGLREKKIKKGSQLFTQFGVCLQCWGTKTNMFEEKIWVEP